MRALVSEYELTIARTLPEGLELLAGDQGWRPIAGGTDVMVLFNAGKLPWRRLVSVRDIEELRRIEVSETEVSIGGAVTYSEIRGDAVLQAEFPLLCRAASWTGAVANQNRGTLGGNIANASPAADSPPMLLVYDSELELASVRGVRRMPYAEFHTGYKQMRLEADELIVRIVLPRRARERVQYARKVGTRKAQAISKVCLAAVAENVGVELQGVRIAAGSVAPVPLRCLETERLLEGKRLNAGILAQAKETIAREIRPITDIRSTEQYRAQVTANLLGEFLESFG